MSKGLKDMVAEALGQAAQSKPPVEISAEATRALATYVRQWAGWSTARLVFGRPTVSPWAECDHETKTFTVNVDDLLLNPNRVLLTLTPFRLRQEAVLTGAMLHEAGHARHSHWLPRNPAEAKANPARHHDGETPSAATLSLARLMEEPRVEGLMFRDADRIGATGLGWTMKASAAHLVPTTALSMDPNRRIMDIIRSWALRAGRQVAMHAQVPGYEMRDWVQDFTTLLHGAIVEHLEALVEQGADIEPHSEAKVIIDTLIEMCSIDDDRGSTMIDKARDVLDCLFPETDPEDQPESGGGCSEERGNGDNEESETGDDKSTGEGDESGEQGEGNTEPEDEGSGDEPGAGDSGQDEAEPEDSEKDSEGGESEQDSEGGESEQDSESGQDGEPEESGASASASTGEQGEKQDTESEMAKALCDMEAASQSEMEDEANDEAEQAEEDAVSTAGSGGDSSGMGGWRQPKPEERDTQKNAELFLRGLINPSESARVSLDDSPAPSVDGAALAAWKAGGGRGAPKFFRRTRRTIEPSPPVQIATLVDVSSSMEELQKPSALLSWALASAALDLRNFAGRGQQVESCLIHWGSTVKVIQPNGGALPGIREFPCLEGTSAMDMALEEVERQMPGFFDITDHPVNRLLVQFTDWELFGRRGAVPWISRALESGVNMLTVAPRNYSPRRSDLNAILAECRVQRGTSTLLKYNPLFPSQVWETAAEALNH